jgi:chromosome segregation ATPase
MTKINARNAQQYINYNYPTKKMRQEETKLYIDNMNLVGRIDLSDFIKLEKLNCSDNQITSLDISKNKLLTEIDCSKNKLTNLDLSNCLNINTAKANRNQLSDIKLPVVNHETLKYLNLLDNSLSQNLSSFSPFVNLKVLLIGNNEDITEQGICNQFHGSLEPLKYIDKLECLNINNTDIDSGLEYLPDSIKCFQCLANKRPHARVNKIFEQLEIYTMSITDALQGNYNLKAWKVNWELAKEKEALQNQIKQIEEELSYDSQFVELIRKENNLNAEEENLIENNIQIKEKIKDLKQLVEELSNKLKQNEVIYQQTKQQLEEKEELINSLTIEQITKKEELYKEINVLKDQLVNKKDDIKQLKTQLGRINDELKVKEDESEDLRSKLHEIELSRAVIKNKREELNVLKKKLDHERYFTKNDTSELRNKICDLKNEIALLRSQASNFEIMNNEFEEVRKNKEVLETEKGIKQTHIEKLKNDKINLRYKLGIRTNEYNDKEDIISELKQQNKQYIEELQNKLDEEKQQNKQHIEELQNKLNKEEQQNKKHIEELQNKLNEESTKYKKLKKKYAKLSAILEKIKQDCEIDLSDTN